MSICVVWVFLFTLVRQSHCANSFVVVGCLLLLFSGIKFPFLMFAHRSPVRQILAYACICMYIFLSNWFLVYPQWIDIIIYDYCYGDTEKVFIFTHCHRHIYELELEFFDRIDRVPWIPAETSNSFSIHKIMISRRRKRVISLQLPSGTSIQFL